jgi:hypothetical protein
MNQSEFKGVTSSPLIYLKKKLGLMAMEEQSRHNQQEVKAPVAD